jgi:hypothetical protein
MKSSVGKITVIKTCDRKHPNQIEQDGNRYCDRTPTDKKNTKTTGVQKNERNTSTQIKFVWTRFDGCDVFFEMIRVPRLH